MKPEMKSQVTVAIDVLEIEALYAKCLGNALQVIAMAAENTQSDEGEAIGGTCWLLQQVVAMHEDVLWSAAKGKLAGPAKEEIA